jgi:Ca2+-binding EF-hand superfamily protein
MALYVNGAGHVEGTKADVADTRRDSLDKSAFADVAKLFDQDGDGQLNDDEEKGLAAYLKNIDSDGDGKISKGELDSAKTNSDKKEGYNKDSAKDWIEKAKNIHGDKEKEFAYGQGKTPYLDFLQDNPTLAGELPNKLIKLFDRDGNGELNGEERKAAEAYLKTKDADGKGFGEDDIRNIMSTIDNVGKDSVDGFFTTAGKSGGGGGSSGGGSGSGGTSGGSGGSIDPNDFLEKLFDPKSWGDAIKNLPPQYRDLILKYLPEDYKKSLGL